MFIELISTLLFIIALFLKYFHLPGGSLLLIISLFSLVIINLFQSRTMNKNKIVIDKSYARLIGIVNAIPLIGIMFKLQYWPLSNIILIIGVTFSLITCAILFFSNKIKNEQQRFFTNPKIIIRIIVILIISIIFLSIPSTRIREIQYGNIVNVY